MGEESDWFEKAKSVYSGDESKKKIKDMTLDEILECNPTNYDLEPPREFANIDYHYIVRVDKMTFNLLNSITKGKLRVGGMIIKHGLSIFNNDISQVVIYLRCYSDIIEKIALDSSNKAYDILRKTTPLVDINEYNDSLNNKINIRPYWWCGVAIEKLSNVTGFDRSRVYRMCLNASLATKYPYFKDYKYSSFINDLIYISLPLIRVLDDCVILSSGLENSDIKNEILHILSKYGKKDDYIYNLGLRYGREINK